MRYYYLTQTCYPSAKNIAISTLTYQKHGQKCFNLTDSVTMVETSLELVGTSIPLSDSSVKIPLDFCD